MSQHPDSEQSRPLYRVGTLAYTRGQLAQVFTWLLLGDFCLHLMDNGVVPTVVPLQLERLGASKTQINFLMGTLVNALYLVLVPIVSTWSDRTRTRMGRRRPFLLVTAPILAIVLVMLGFSTNLARWASALMPGVLGGYSVAAVALGLTMALFIAFKLLDLFPQSVYYYLWPDVIPAEWLGTFGALFRVFYAGGSLVFNWYLIGLAKEHPEKIYMLSAGLYLAAFLVLVWRVKEPEYPAVVPVSAGAGQGTPAGSVSRMGAGVVSYFRECFSHPYYWTYFLAMALFQCAYQPFVGNIIFFGKQIYGTDEAALGRYGSVMGTKDIVWICIFLALVPVMRKFHPLKAGLLGYGLMCLAGVAGTFFIHDEVTFRYVTIGVFGVVGFYLVGTAALPARMLPKEAYGQFSSAGAMLVRLMLMVIFTPAGWVFEHFGPRFVYAWLLTFVSLGAVAMVLLYVQWKRLGGESGFQPPAPGSPALRPPAGP